MEANTVTPLAPASAIWPSRLSRCSTESVSLGQHWRNHDMTVKAGFADRGDQTEPGLWRRRSRLDLLVQLWVSHRERYSHADLDAGGCIRDERKIAAQQRALGEDGERRAGIRQCSDDPGISA